MKRLRPVLSLLFGLVLIVPASAETRLNVVTSFSILADFVRQVGGDKVTVRYRSPLFFGADGQRLM